jgi:hypothetical protein
MLLCVSPVVAIAGHSGCGHSRSQGTREHFRSWGMLTQRPIMDWIREPAARQAAGFPPFPSIGVRRRPAGCSGIAVRRPTAPAFLGAWRLRRSLWSPAGRARRATPQHVGAISAAHCAVQGSAAAIASPSVPRANRLRHPRESASHGTAQCAALIAPYVLTPPPYPPTRGGR